MNIALLVLLLLGGGFALALLWFERSRTDEKVIALTAALGAIAAVARIPFAVIPNVQPTTFLVMLSGYIFGTRVGFLVGTIAAVLSNIYLGQGPWTIWQMFAWGMAGCAGGLLGLLMEKKGRTQVLSNRMKRWVFTLMCTLWGFVFGWIMNLWIFLGLGSFMNWKSFLAIYASSFSFDAAHAIGNLVFASLFGTVFAKIFVRYHRKLIVTRIQTGEAQE